MVCPSITGVGAVRRRGGLLVSAIPVVAAVSAPPRSGFGLDLATQSGLTLVAFCVATQ